MEGLVKFFIVSMLFLSNLNAATIKVGSSPVISSAGIYLANERNYFKEQGLTVEIIDFNNSGAQMTVLLAKGELDVGAGNISSGLLNAIAKGQNFKLVADKGHLEKGKEYIALIVRTDHLTSGRYKTLKDLKGFKIGLTALDGVSQQIVAEKFLAKAGLSNNDVEFVKLSYPEMNVALKTKNIDATIQIEPYLTKAEVDGVAKKVASATDVHPNQQSAALFYSPAFMEKNPLQAKQFMVAYLQGVRDYNKAFISGIEKQKAISDLKKYIKIDDDRVWNNMVAIGLSNDGLVDVNSIMEDVKWYYSKKYLEKMPTAEQVVDLHYAKEATIELSKAKK
jgi:NitT/TauT family transport system substrate-binding protein